MLKLLKLNIKKDQRGFFLKLFSTEEFSEQFKNFRVNQINLSSNKKKGTIRGLHLQKSPHSEKKIIFCLKGKIFDVVVDMRKNSKDYLKVKTFILDEKENQLLVIPKGYAHGFQTLKNNTQILYFHSGFYKKNYESDINPFDPKIKIKWPLKVSKISQKDKKIKFI
tara:strand:+ start:5802 stop:6299 length:498 start_codon:yes stop_codon:yes gene_type:complete